MRRHLTATVLAAACLLTTQACYDLGSCFYTTPQGFDYCEDYLGTQYNQGVTKDTCAEGKGTWSAKACTHEHALGNCAVSVADTGNAQNVLYTYYADTSAAVPATVLTAETACGLAGGEFTVE